MNDCQLLFIFHLSFFHLTSVAFYGNAHIIDHINFNNNQISLMKNCQVLFEFD